MSASERPAAPISLFYSYSHKDEALADEARDPPEPLAGRQGVISGWHDRRIGRHGVGRGQIDREPRGRGHHPAAGQCRLPRLGLLLGRGNRSGRWSVTRQGTARVIPVILRPCDWHTAPFGKLQALPKDGKPVTTWTNRDEAFTTSPGASARP